LTARTAGWYRARHAFEPDPAGYFVFLQHAGLFAIDRIVVRTDFDFPTGDVAVVTLAAPVTGDRPTPPQLSGSPAFGAAGTSVGFGRRGDGSPLALEE
jgi:hypothetical protein